MDTECKTGPNIFQVKEKQEPTLLDSPEEEDVLKKKISIALEVPSSSEDVDDDSYGDLVVPPDGGWGWVIVFASFMTNVIVDGIIFSFGIFLMELATAFNETKAKTAWVGSLLAGCYLLIGPVASGFTNSFGSRAVCIAGAFIAAGGFILSFFATSISYLIFSFGVIGGIGFGFIYLPATTLACFYFDRKRALAMGIAVCGSGIGTFSVAPLVQYLLDAYGWRGAILILAGLILNCAVFGCLYRPLEPPRRAPSKEELPEIPEEARKPLLLRIKEARDAMNKWDSSEEVAVSNQAIDRKFSLQVPATYLRNQRMPSASPTSSEGSPPPPYSEVSSTNFNIPVRKASQQIGFYDQRRRSSTRSVRKRIDASRPFYRQDILFSCSLVHLPEFRSQPDLAHYHRSVTKLPANKRGSVAPDLISLEESEEGSCFPAMLDTFKQMLDISLLASPTFVVLCIAGFLTLAGFFVPFIYVIDMASLSGIGKEEGTLILSAIGITNTVGRVFSGWISDRPNVNALMINNIALTAGGIATIMMPLVVEIYWLLLVCAAVFGFSIACFAALRSIILVQLHGLDKLSNTIGLLLLFQGLASIVGAPVAGLFFNSTGSYHASFYIAGSLISISGIMCFPLPAISRWEKEREAKRACASLQKELLIGEQSSDV